jgi:Raffinose synthase or seed imbibition protein Sip1
MTSALSDRNPNLDKQSPGSSSSESTRSRLDIAAGAIMGGSVAHNTVETPVVAVEINTWYTRLRKVRRRIGSAFMPENIKESLQENLPDGLFKGGLLQLSQRILALTNTSEPSVAVKRSYSRPTPHLLLVEPALAWDPSALVGVGSVAPNKLEEMYKRMHTYLADAGIDGVKVDAQSGIGAFGVGNGGGSTIAQACVRAVENSAKSAFSAGSRLKFSEKNALFNLQLQQRVGTLGQIVRKTRGILGLSAQNRAQEVDSGGLLKDSPLALTGCMCHSTENLLNYYETSMARASDDFYPKDMAAQTVHLVSCAYNTVMLGEIATTDWDMFHSKHPFAAMHAAARAISGGPVYVSDSPGNHDPELLGRLVLPDGGILRAQIPARPTVDCLFSDVQQDGISAMKLWSLNKVGAVAGVFNVQGSSWDRKQRRYVQYTPSIILPTLTTELRARDIGGSFSSLLEPVEGASDSNQGVKGLKAEGRDKNMLEMFAAWSSREKKMTVLTSRNDVMSFEVQPKGWDVISMSRILLVPGTVAKVKKIRPFVQLKNLFGRLKIKRGHKNVDNNSGSSDINANDGESSTTAVTVSAKESGNSDAVYWSPIGLLDMLNTGGAVERILPPKSTRSALFLAKGPGRFGVFTSQRPKQVTIDGAVCDFTYEPLPEERTKQNIVLSDGMGRGIKVGLNISPEVMIKEFMLKMGEMSDEVQTFIKEASNEYADMLGSLKEKSGSGVDKIPVKGGLISFILRSEGDTTAPPHKLNPLSGVRKVAMYW